MPFRENSIINIVGGRMYFTQKTREGCHTEKRELYSTELSECSREELRENGSPPRKAVAKGQEDNRKRKKRRGCRHPGPADMENQLVLMGQMEREGLQEMTQREDRHVQTRKKKKNAGNARKPVQGRSSGNFQKPRKSHKRGCFLKNDTGGL